MATSPSRGDSLYGMGDYNSDSSSLVSSPKHETTPLIGKDDSDIDEKGVETPVEQKQNFKSQYDRLRVIVCILCVEMCERLTYYSIGANLVLFCTNVLKLSSSQAVVISYVFTGTSYFVPVFGGFIADSIAGKFNTIYGSALIYFAGASLLPVVSIEFLEITGGEYVLTVEQKRIFYLIGLTLIAIGTGGIKSNVGPFGAQQTEDLGQKAVQTFFNWFYWFINVGSALAFSIVVYIQQEVSFVIGYLIPVISILIAVVLLLIGRNSYINKPPEGSAYSRVGKILYQSVRRLRSKSVSGTDIDSCLDRAKETNGGSYLEVHVEEVKSLGRIVPVFLTIIPYWTIYMQMQSVYFLQGERMRLTHGDFTIPISSLNLFNIAIILVMIPLMDRVIYPCLENKGINFTPLRRMGFGMILATVSVILAAIVEICRKNELRTNGGFPQEISNQIYNSSNISIFAQVPQFTLIGASEIFTSITGLEFAYSQSPPAMQGVVMGMFLLTTGLGSYLGSLLVIIVNAATPDDPWLPDEVNDGYLERFFFLLAILMIVDFVIFVLIAWKYKYVEKEDVLFLDSSYRNTPDSSKGAVVKPITESETVQSQTNEALDTTM
ncbi:solute carrier family 15 member 4-like [Glandiceps talaboti]